MSQNKKTSKMCQIPGTHQKQNDGNYFVRLNTVNIPTYICRYRIGAGVLRKGEYSAPTLACTF